MTGSGELKDLVRERMERTGEKYTAAYRALLVAACAGIPGSDHTQNDCPVCGFPGVGYYVEPG